MTKKITFNPIWLLKKQKSKNAKIFMYGMDKSKLQLVPHDASWKDDFLLERGRIASAVGDTSVCIEHVGSTSIPAVYAKPILDIAILCGAKGLAPVIDALVRLGYEYRGQFGEEIGHYYVVLDKDNTRLCQAHIYVEENADWHSKLKFRNALTQNADLAREYSDYKLKLAKIAANKTEYAEIKTKWIDKFILKVFAAADETK